MMKLTRELEGKRVRVVTHKGSIYTGVVEDYIYPEDNEPEGIAGIDIKCADGWAGMNETDIKSIDLL